MSAQYDYLIIGAGIVGAATAYTISKRYPGARIGLVDKEAGPAVHQTSHNSGVIHAGIYYAPDSAKAKLCRAGLAATYEFAAEHGIATLQTGKLLVATSMEEVGRLEALSKRATRNNAAVQMLSQAELAELEPHVSGLAAMRVRDTGIVDYGEIARKLLELSLAECSFDAEVLAIQEAPNEVLVSTNRTSLSAKKLIVCAGLQADRMARLAGLETDIAIFPFRGDFYVLHERYNQMFEHLIYPVPDPRLPFLGVHLTRHIDGTVSVGPSAMLALARESYGKYRLNFTDCLEIFFKKAFWLLMSKYPRATANELAMALSQRLYSRAARRYCSSLTAQDFIAHRCGIRAQAVNRRGELMHDFMFERTARMLHVLNAPSPAATAALPIGGHIVDSL